MKGDDEGAEAELNYDETLGLGDFVAGERDEPLAPPAGFTEWRRKGAVWAASLYEPDMLGSADARTSIQYGGQSQPVINLSSYNYLGLANHPKVIEAATAAFRQELDQGYFATVSDASGQADQVRELPVDAELVILRRPIAGG